MPKPRPSNEMTEIVHYFTRATTSVRSSD
jgi:hypothetical protein